MNCGLMPEENQIRYGFVRRRNVRRALLLESHSEIVQPEHSGIYRNLFLMSTAGGLSAAQIARKVNLSYKKF